MQYYHGDSERCKSPLAIECQYWSSYYQVIWYIYWHCSHILSCMHSLPSGSDFYLSTPRLVWRVLTSPQHPSTPTPSLLYTSSFHLPRSSTRGNELLLRAGNRRLSAMRKQLFAKVLFDSGCLALRVYLMVDFRAVMMIRVRQQI